MKVGQSEFVLEVTDPERTWGFWMPIRTNTRFKSALEARVWTDKPKNRLVWAGNSCDPQGIVPTRVRVIERKVVTEFRIR